MNKSQLIEAVAKDLALPKNEVKRIVESLFKISVDKLRGGEKVVISGFGVFSVALSAARIGRNPRTGAAVKKREDVHKMAEANKAFAHFRW